MRLEEEKEKREEYLENIGDVTKQKDLGKYLFIYLFTLHIHTLVHRRT